MQGEMGRDESLVPDVRAGLRRRSRRCSDSWVLSQPVKDRARAGVLRRLVLRYGRPRAGATFAKTRVGLPARGTKLGGVDYQGILDEIVSEVGGLPGEGAVADYIPELARVDPAKFGMALECVDGRSFAAGDYETRFSIQSMAKVLTLSLGCSINAEAVWSRVGVEPSGNPFNSLVQLEYESGIPRNPLINAGALVVSDVLLELLREPKRELLEFVRGLGGIDSVEFDPRVAQSEMQTADRNRALTHFMRSFGNIRHEVEQVLDFYVHTCSLAMSCQEVARTYSFLANHGVCVIASRRTLSVTQVRRINSIMLTCGFYDEAGEFAFRVGLPGKSGVGGGIVAVCPGRFTVAAWSPRLGPKGNSVLATEALRRFAQRTGASVF